MDIKFLSSKNYVNNKNNCGDCIIITTDTKIIVYDCGCEEHARRVMNIMKDKGFNKIVGVLSHNDQDHFNGFKMLLDENKIDCIYTICALKHVDDILTEINDNRYKRESVKEKLLEVYSNVEELSGYLKDIYDTNKKPLSTDIIDGVKIMAPNYEYAIKTIARAIKNSEPNTIDGDSVMNAASVCLKIYDSSNNMLLTGDSTFENIKDNLENINYVQLPHHGRAAQIDDIFKYFDDNDLDPTYLISDNTGDSNGGVDKRKIMYRNHKNTLDGDFEISYSSTRPSTRTTGTLGVGLDEMLYRYK